MRILRKSKVFLFFIFLKKKNGPSKKKAASLLESIDISCDIRFNKRFAWIFEVHKAWLIWKSNPTYAGK